MSKLESKNSYGPQEGFSMLVLAVVISSAGLIFAVAASRIGMRQADLGMIAGEGARARYVAQNCMEEALVRVFNDPGYTAENTQFDTIGGSCLVAVSGEADKQISVKGRFEDSYAALAANVQTASGEIEIIGYEED